MDVQYIPIYNSRFKWEISSIQCTLKQEGSGLFIEALHLWNSLILLSGAEILEHTDAQRRIHTKPCNCKPHTQNINTEPVLVETTTGKPHLNEVPLWLLFG